MTKTVLILGGYGHAGRPITDLLLKETKDTNIILAGRHLELAQEESDKLNAVYTGHRVYARQVDASSPSSLESAFQDINLVVVASSTTAYAPQVMEAALNAKIDYFDIQVGASIKMDALDSLKDRIDSSGCCFVTDGGVHPGIPAALIRYAALECDSLETANVYTFMQPNWKELNYSDDTAEEFVREMSNMKNDVYSQGKWEPQGWTVVREFDFGEPVRKQTCAPMYLEEMRELPDTYPTLNEVGMYIAGFDPVTIFLVMPLGLLATALCPRLATRPMAKLFQWSLKKFSKPPYGCVLVLEAEGEKKGSKVNYSIRISHEDEYILTAVPAVSCLLQLLDGSQRKPGIHYQAQFVEPKRFLADMKRMGLDIGETAEPADTK